MKRITVLSLIALATGLSTSPAFGDEDIDGAMVYAANCNRCHEYRSPVEFNGPQWSIITTHMRVIAGLPGDETRAVYRFLKAQRDPPLAAVASALPAAEAAANDVERGKALVQERGCLGCHVVEGRGGAMGPPLDGVAHRRPETFVLQQLRNPQTNYPGSLMPNLGLADPEIAAIWAYLQAL